MVKTPRIIPSIDATLDQLSKAAVTPLNSSDYKELKLKLDLPYIKHEQDGEAIYQRMQDGYINATAMCKAANKRFHDYSINFYTQAFINELAVETGIPASELIQQVKGAVGGDPTKQGTWVHPQVAIHLAQWLSPKFAVQVTKWIFDWFSGNIPKATLPYHLRRYVANLSAIPHTHFSILQMLSMDLIAPLEQQGYTLPENMLPDISQGKMFCNWLRKVKGIDPAKLPTYIHRYEDGRQVEAKLYPNSLLYEFKEHFHNVWMPQRAEKYFEERDAKALPYLTQILRISAPEDKMQKIENHSEE